MLESHGLSFPTSMRAVLAASVFATALGAASTAMAVSLGAVSNASRLGQPLDFAVAVKLDPEEALPPHCVFAEVTAGDHQIPAGQVRARLVRGGRSDDAVARVTTTVRLNEPVVTVTLSLGCPARLSHKFVSLLDPPAASARAAAPTPTAAPAAAVPPTQETAAPAGPAADPSRELLQGLESRVERLRQDHEATQQTLQVLQLRLREAEQATRQTDPAIYGLTSLVLMLLAVIALLLWRLTRLQRGQSWAAESRALAEQGALSETPRVAPSLVTPPLDEVTMTSMRVVADPARAPDAEAPVAVREAAQTTLPSAARVRRELSAEELLDLEQQADFFMVLGQEDAAIDLLMSHVRSSGGTSPMPYLKLLEIYRRNGDGAAYERIRERFNRRFNAHAPPWEDDPRDARTLGEYPEIVQRLQRAWPVPAQAIEMLEALLFRRDSSDETFELAAYEELLFLYAIMRDVVEHTVDPSGVDLLLPIGPDEVVSSITRAEVTQPPESWRRPPAGDVDLEIDIGPDTPGRR
jgi:pilus assembly protein FimV